jgi:hypothetical protein
MLFGALRNEGGTEHTSGSTMRTQITVTPIGSPIASSSDRSVSEIANRSPLSTAGRWSRLDQGSTIGFRSSQPNTAPPAGLSTGMVPGLDAKVMGTEGAQGIPPRRREGIAPKAGAKIVIACGAPTFTRPLRLVTEYFTSPNTTGLV